MKGEYLRLMEEAEIEEMMVIEERAWSISLRV